MIDCNLEELHFVPSFYFLCLGSYLFSVCNEGLAHRTNMLCSLYVGVYSFADLQKPQLELDGKPCAAVGQSGLMALYDGLLTQVRK